MSYSSGRHFLQIPGPTNVPERVLRAISAPTIDHRGGAFGKFASDLLESVRAVFLNFRPGDYLPVVRHRRVGSGDGEHAVARRSCADV